MVILEKYIPNQQPDQMLRGLLISGNGTVVNTLYFIFVLFLIENKCFNKEFDRNICDLAMLSIGINCIISNIEKIESKKHHCICGSVKDISIGNGRSEEAK